MGFRFRKIVGLGPGVRVNLSKKGASLSLGGKGFTVNLGKDGTRTTLGAPGTGLSYDHYTSHADMMSSNVPLRVKLLVGLSVLAAILAVIFLY